MPAITDRGVPVTKTPSPDETQDPFDETGLPVIGMPVKQLVQWQAQNPMAGTDQPTAYAGTDPLSQFLFRGHPFSLPTFIGPGGTAGATPAPFKPTGMQYATIGQGGVGTGGAGGMGGVPTGWDTALQNAVAGNTLNQPAPTGGTPPGGTTPTGGGTGGTTPTGTPSGGTTQQQQGGGQGVTPQDVQQVYNAAPPPGINDIPESSFASLIAEAMKGSKGTFNLSALAPYVMQGHFEFLKDPTTGAVVYEKDQFGNDTSTPKYIWQGGGPTARAKFLQDIYQNALDIEREDMIRGEQAKAQGEQQKQQFVTQMLQAALQNPSAFAALNYLKQGQLSPLLGGLPGIGMQLPGAPGGQNLFPGGIPTLGQLNSAGPEGQGFLTSLLNYSGMPTSEIARTAGSVTPGAFGGINRPFAGGTERAVSPFMLPDAPLQGFGSMDDTQKLGTMPELPPWMGQYWGLTE